MTQRVTLRAVLKTPEGDYQPNASLELDDVTAGRLIKTGKARLSELQKVYVHEDEMPAAERERALEALAVADAAGGINAQVARAAATAPYRKVAK